MNTQVYNHEAAAAYLGISKQTLYNWRHNRRGPDYTLMGRKPIYLKTDLDAYQKKNKVILNPYADGGLFFERASVKGKRKIARA